MLVLSRRPGESINIGDDVVVTVLEIHGDTVRVGIDAPRTVRVHRDEVYRRLQEENRAAAQSDDSAAAALGSLLSGRPLAPAQSAPPATAPPATSGPPKPTPPRQPPTP